MSQIAANLKKQIELKKVSVLGLERSAGLRPGALQNILHGRSKKPNINTIQSVAKALQCSVEELLDGSLNVVCLPFDVEEKWNQDLYFSVFIRIINFINESNVQLKKNDFLKIADEIYNYSAENDINDVDERFMKWYISKKCDISNKND
ncbi:MAG: hypothetical protein HEEMFOPI_01218 [Holosporales bacterium]